LAVGTEVAHVTLGHITCVRWRVRRLQRSAWERVGRGKLLLCCRLLGGSRRFSAHGGRRGAGARLQLVWSHIWRSNTVLSGHYVKLMFQSKNRQFSYNA